MNLLISTAILLYIIPQCFSSRQAYESNGYDELGLSTAEVISLRGYSAKEYKLTTEDGYILNLIRATNPHINNGQSLPNRSILLMVHGIHTNSKVFVVNSIGVKAGRDLSELKVANLSEAELWDLLSEEPASNSLVFSLLDFGGEVWMLDRRGTGGSREHSSRNSTICDLTGFDLASHASSLLHQIVYGNSRQNSSQAELFRLNENCMYWNFTLDQQAQFDLPQTIDFVLSSTGRKSLSVLGYSAGGAIALMTFARNPKIMSKIDKALLWAPALDLGGAHPNNYLLYKVGSLLFSSLHAPMPAQWLVPITEVLLAIGCSSTLAQSTICQLGIDNNYGWGGGQQNAVPGIIANIYDVCSYGEYAQLCQSYLYGRTHYIDFESHSMNMAAYGSPRPPAYNISTFDTDALSIWHGGTDSLVTPAAIQQIKYDLKNGDKVETHFLESPEMYFNHFSFGAHKEIGKLLIVPCLKTILTS